MHVVVLNLLRLGDLVQCSPVFRSLRARYPEARITLIVQDIFQETAMLLPGPDRVLPVPYLKLAPLLDQKGAWPEAYQFLADWLEENLQPRPDLVINLTPTLLGAIFSFLSRAPEVRGLTLNASRQFLTQPSWMSYLMVISRARRANPFNLVDIFLKGGGLEPDGAGLTVEIPAAALGQAEAFLGDYP